MAAATAMAVIAASAAVAAVAAALPKGQRPENSFLAEDFQTFAKSAPETGALFCIQGAYQLMRTPMLSA